MSQTLLQLEKCERAVEYCLFSYQNTFVNKNIHCDSEGSDFWIWEYRPAHQELHFCIRGSDEFADVMRDVSILPALIGDIGFACSGFEKGAEIVLKRSLSYFMNAQQNNINIILSGHSYGGAVAQVLQQKLKYYHGIDSECITFGSPRVWFPLASLKGEHTRVHIDDDPVTKLPFLGHLIGLYKHRETNDLLIRSDGWISIKDHEIKTYQEFLAKKVQYEQTRLHDETIQNPRTGESSYIRGTRRG